MLPKISYLDGLDLLRLLALILIIFLGKSFLGTDVCLLISSAKPELS